MLYSIIWAIAPAIGLASAFKDTSPFFLFSTSELLVQAQPDIVSASSITSTIVSLLETCPSDDYIIVSQPNVLAADFESKRSTLRLRQMMNGDDKNIRSSVAVRDVVGQVDSDQFAQVLKGKCGVTTLRLDASTRDTDIANNTRARVVYLDFPALPTEENKKAKQLAENDVLLSSILTLLTSPKFTVLYTTTPSSQSSGSSNEPDSVYQMDSSIYQSPLHLDLKRDLSSTSKERDVSGDKPVLPDGPLFERYSFLSPGLFMGILVTFLLLSILYVGISAIAGLQVTYAAFDKEMGPAAQKKAQ